MNKEWTAGDHASLALTSEVRETWVRMQSLTQEQMQGWT